MTKHQILALAFVGFLLGTVITTIALAFYPDARQWFTIGALAAGLVLVWRV